jgi:hypothetical protein
MRQFERGWRLVHVGDPDIAEVALGAYCPVCAPRALDDLFDAVIVGGVQVTDSTRMEFVIDFGRLEADIVVTTSGSGDAGGFRRFNRAIAGDPRLFPRMKILIDHSRLDASTLIASDLEPFGSSVEQLRERVGSSRVAIVVPDTSTYVSATRSYEHAHGLEVDARIFYSRFAAVSWLNHSAAARAVARIPS